MRVRGVRNTMLPTKSAKIFKVRAKYKFHTRPDRPWEPHSLMYNGYRVFTGGKEAGAWCWPPTPPSAEVKERVELYL